MEQKDPDRELVERAQRELPRRTRAYDEIVRRHSGRVYQRSFRILQSEQDAEEATQDTFLAVFRSLPRYRPERPFSHWLQTIALNSCRMILRRRAAERRRREAAANEGEPPPAEVEADPTLRKVVGELLDELDPGTRIPLVMRFIEGHSYAEIAAEMDLSESAAKMRVSRGSKRLRELFEERREAARRRREEARTSDGDDD